MRALRQFAMTATDMEAISVTASVLYLLSGGRGVKMAIVEQRAVPMIVHITELAVSTPHLRSDPEVLLALHALSNLCKHSHSRARIVKEGGVDLAVAICEGASAPIQQVRASEREREEEMEGRSEGGSSTRQCVCVACAVVEYETQRDSFHSLHLISSSFPSSSPFLPRCARRCYGNSHRSRRAGRQL